MEFALCVSIKLAHSNHCPVVNTVLSLDLSEHSLYFMRAGATVVPGGRPPSPVGARPVAGRPSVGADAVPAEGGRKGEPRPPRGGRPAALGCPGTPRGL